MGRKGVDEHPGSLPNIRSTEHGVVFEFDHTSGEQGGRLVIRCDDDGEVYVRIAPDNHRRQ